MIDFTKIDPKSFDISRVFDVQQAIDTAASTTGTMIKSMPQGPARNMAEAVTEASFEFARAQAQAAQTFAEAVRRAVGH